MSIVMRNKNFFAEKSNRKTIGTTWLTGNSSCTLVIPKSLAQEYGLDKPSNVVIQGRPEGILIAKLKLENSNCPHCGAKADTLKNHDTEYTQIHKDGSGGLAAKQIPLDPAVNMLVCKRHDDLAIGSTCLIGSEYHVP